MTFYAGLPQPSINSFIKCSRREVEPPESGSRPYQGRRQLEKKTDLESGNFSVQVKLGGTDVRYVVIPVEQRPCS